MRTVRLPAGRGHLFGDLYVPEAARGLVVFAHGSGGGRHSPRNQRVAVAGHRVVRPLPVTDLA